MDFAKLVRLIKAAAAFIPQVIEIIKVVQASMPGDGRGAARGDGEAEAAGGEGDGGDAVGCSD